MSKKGTEKRWWSQSKDSIQEMENQVFNVQTIHQEDQPDDLLLQGWFREMNDV